jgi:hypothetical protein
MASGAEATLVGDSKCQLGEGIAITMLMKGEELPVDHVPGIVQLTHNAPIQFTQHGGRLPRTAQ